jgi:hypothetical protein
VASGERFAPYRPYFCCLADETGISELATQWDFDFSDISLMPMSRWLRRECGGLSALNAEWGTHFTDWDLAMPPGQWTITVHNLLGGQSVTRSLNVE